MSLFLKGEKENNGKLNLPFSQPLLGSVGVRQKSISGDTVASHLGPRPSQSGVWPTTLCSPYP